MLMHLQVGDKKVNGGLYSPCIQSFEKGELCLEDHRVLCCCSVGMKYSNEAEPLSKNLFHKYLLNLQYKKHLNIQRWNIRRRRKTFLTIRLL